MTVQLSGQMPGEQVNGLLDLEPELIKDETMRVTAVVVFEVVWIKHNVQKGETYPVVRLVQIEPIVGDGLEKVKQLQMAAYQERTGENTLDMPDVPDEDGAEQ